MNFNHYMIVDNEEDLNSIYLVCSYYHKELPIYIATINLGNISYNSRDHFNYVTYKNLKQIDAKVFLSRY